MASNVFPLDNAEMSLGTRIGRRLEAVGITQSELARRVGVRQSTINSLIRGDSRTSRSLLKIARELRTTPAYLTGETDDPDAESPPAPDLASNARELVEYFEALAPIDQRALLQLVRTMAGGNAPSETVHQPGRGYKGEGADHA